MKRPRRRRLQPFNRVSSRTSRRTRLSLALVFATVFAPGTPNPAGAGCVPFDDESIVSTATDSPLSVFAADVDGDGDLDVLTASFYDATIAWFENDASGGGWTFHQISTSAITASQVSAADVDGDGDVDVLSASYGETKVAWYENDGAGAGWTLQTITLDVVQPPALATADIDGDGDPDVLSVSYGGGGRVAWHENDPADGLWTLHSISVADVGPGGLAVADVDRDGDTDVLSAAFYSNEVTWWANDGGGGGWTPHTIADLGGPLGFWWVVAADVDGDGDADAVTSALVGPDRVAWHENDGTGEGWTLHTISLEADDPRTVAVADLDGDGDLDVLSASYGDSEVAWYENDGDGTIWTRHTLSTTATGAWPVIAADLDGDGDADPIAAAWEDDAVLWFRNDLVRGEALFEDPATVATVGVSGWFETVDLDHDGDLDLLGPSVFPGDLVWYENDGDAGGWTSHSVEPGGVGARKIATADVDHDGDLDVLSSGATGSGVLWHENNGSGGGWGTSTIATAGSIDNRFFALDVDHDGDTDLVGPAAAYSGVGWHENLAGDGSSWTMHTVFDGFVSLDQMAVADVDGDGDADVVWGTYGDGLVWFENGGDGDGWTPHTTALPGSVFGLDTVDVDRDGDVDVVARTSSFGALSEGVTEFVWLANDGAGGGWTASILASSVNGRGIRAGDLDGDGDVDALVGEYGDKTAPLTAWIENLPPGDGSSWTVHTLSTTGGPAHLAIADLDGDGDADAVTLPFGGPDANQLLWYENVGTKVFANGFDSEKGGGPNLGCWSTSVP